MIAVMKNDDNSNKATSSWLSKLTILFSSAYAAFAVFCILLVFSLIYDYFIPKYPNKIVVDTKHGDVSTAILLFYVAWGGMIFYLCSEKYKILSWLMTAVFIIYIALMIYGNMHTLPFR